MNILFLTMDKITTIEERRIYPDLMRKLRDEGHEVYIVCPVERRERKKTSLCHKEGVHLLNVRTLNVQKTNIIEKGLGQVTLEYLFKRAIVKYLKNVSIDLILYSTPPITILGVVKMMKKRYSKALTYLMLKDIFPQNAVDLGMLTKTGIKGLLYKYFRNQERNLYQISDVIGCTSPANVHYVREHNPEINPRKVEICPNSIELRLEDSEFVSEKDRKNLLEHYNLPIDKPIVIYGGNLGIPQGISFLIECFDANKDRGDCHFLVLGNGTEFKRLSAWVKEKQPKNMSLFSRLPKADYDRLVQVSQIGLIALDYRFTIPNYPSRELDYMKYCIPMLVVTDPNCDTGIIAQENGFGVWCPSNNVEAFTATLNDLLKKDLKAMGKNAFLFLKDNYLVENTYEVIMNHLK